MSPSSSPSNGLPRYLTRPSLFALVAKEPREMLRQLEVADRSDTVAVFYSGPQLDIMEYEALRCAADFAEKAGNAGGEIVIAADNYLEATGLACEDDPDAQLLDSLRRLAEGQLRIEASRSSHTVSLLSAFEFDVGRAEPPTEGYFYYLTIDPLVLQLARLARGDENTGQIVLDVVAASAAVARERLTQQATAAAAADASIAAAARRARTDGPLG